MKNRLLLISAILLFSLNAYAAEEKNPENLYLQAKAAYENDDFEVTVDLLTEYLIQANPDSKRINSIYSVIGWCTVYFRKGTTYHQVYGVVHSGSYRKENEFGAKMRTKKLSFFLDK